MSFPTQVKETLRPTDLAPARQKLVCETVNIQCDTDLVLAGNGGHAPTTVKLSRMLFPLYAWQDLRDPPLVAGYLHLHILS